MNHINAFCRAARTMWYGIENWSGYNNATVVLLPAGYTRQAGEDRSMSDFQIRGLKAVHGEHVYVCIDV